MDAERHWDQLCIAVMTIGTAARAAVIILYNPNTAAQAGSNAPFVKVRPLS